MDAEIETPGEDIRELSSYAASGRLAAEERETGDNPKKKPIVPVPGRTVKPV